MMIGGPDLTVTCKLKRIVHPLKCDIISLTPEVVRRTVAMVSSPHCFSCTSYMLATHVAIAG